MKIGFLGGLGEFGKNITFLESEGKILLIDCGAKFPDSDVFGIDLVVPDISYLEENADKICGLVLTHGHEDHIGAVPFLLKRIPIPIFATPLTLGILEMKLREQKVNVTETTLMGNGRGVPVKDIMAGPFVITPIPVTHSIPDAVALKIKTKEGTIIHTGDFKFDQTPIDGNLTNYDGLIKSGIEGVLALLIDSTNVEVVGMSGPEKEATTHIESYIQEQKQKLIISIFSTNVCRLQEIYNLAKSYGKRVVLCGRSLTNVAKVAGDLGYLRIPHGVSLPVEEVKSKDPSNIIIISAGSQGEPLSALSRIAFDDMKNISIVEGDMVLISARIIPGNEKRVDRIINQIYKKGGEVITVRNDRIHVSGHACREELKMMMQWIKPKYVIPIHGEYRQLKGNAQIATSVGFNDESIVLAESGDLITFEKGELKIFQKIPVGSLLIDGDSSEPIEEMVIRHRRHLSEDGIVIPVVVINLQTGAVESEPHVISHGYTVPEENHWVEGVKKEIMDMLYSLPPDEIKDANILRAKVKSITKRYLKNNIQRIPLIMPVVMEI